jgi:hypothetical protein
MVPAAQGCTVKIDDVKPLILREKNPHLTKGAFFAFTRAIHAPAPMGPALLFKFAPGGFVVLRECHPLGP